MNCPIMRKEGRKTALSNLHISPLQMSLMYLPCLSQFVKHCESSPLQAISMSGNMKLEDALRASSRERPMAMFKRKIGPEMQAVIAISPNPFLVMATLALISPKQFPKERNVIRSACSGIPVSCPKMVIISTTVPEAALIHQTLMIIATIEQKKLSDLGGTSGKVKKATQIAKIMNGIRLIANT